MSSYAIFPIGEDQYLTNTMQIATPFRNLGPVDSLRLSQLVSQLPETEWSADNTRQNRYSAHSATQSLVLLYCDGWPEVKIAYGNAWRYLASEAAPLMENIVDAYYPADGVVLRAMVARLPSGAEILRHRDAHPSFAVAHRVHVPLATNPQVEFTVDDERIKTTEHVAFEINNMLYHQVVNRGTSARLHFIFDYAPPYHQAPRSGQ